MESLTQAFFQYPGSISLILALMIWLIWRLWRFSIIPLLYPKDPKELPYCIPYLGHAFGFFMNSYSVFDKGRKHFKNSKEPYSITIAGQVVYVITSPDDVQSLYKHTTTLSWQRFVQDLYHWMGISHSSIDKLWQAPTEEQRLLHPDRKLPPNEMVEQYEHRQLLPGESLDRISKKFMEHLDKKLQWHQIQHNSAYTIENHSEWTKISLMDWTADIFIHTITELYWGKSIWQVAPNLIDTFRIWEQTTWKYVFRLPRFWSKDMYEAKDQLVDAFMAYFSLPKEKRKDTNYFVVAAEEELRDIALNDHDLARINMLQLWAVNGNLHKVTFWIFAYIAHNPVLLEEIRMETGPGVINNTPNIPYLLENCPLLESIFHEILRLKMSSSLMRYVTEPTIVGRKLLRPGRNVMVPYRQLHFSEDVWGASVYQFDPHRFLREKKLSRSPSFRPFGGGQHLCPGRFLAKQAVFVFMALCLSRFDISLDTGPNAPVQRFPRADETKPGLGTLAPRGEDKVTLQLRPRSTKQSESQAQRP